MGNVMVGAMVCVMAVVNFASAVSASTSTQLFFDDFTGTALDTSRWSVFVDIHRVYHWPYVADGLLHSQGYHTRIDSIPTFAPMGQSVMARAQIRLTGESQKFGFAVNPDEHAGPITGYYFDTLALDPPQGREGYVRALAWSNPGDGSLINLLDVEVPVTWYEFHEFAVERTPSEVIYSIDGHEVARVADAFAGALPVGVWNDRWSLMQTDWVEVSQIIRAIGVPIDIKPGSCPNPLNVKDKGVLSVAILGSEDFDVWTVDVASIRLEGVAPVRSSYEDVSTPVADGADVCECTTAGPDGQLDLTLKFNVQDIVTALGQVNDGDELELTLIGALDEVFGGTPIEGTDCVVIISKDGK